MKFMFQDPKDNKPSRKSTYAFLSFLVAVGISIIGLWKGIEAIMIIQLVGLWLGIFGALMSLTVWNKKIEK